jgi:hypothetical protein
MNVLYFLKTFCRNSHLTVNDFLDAFSQSRKAPISSFPSICPSVCMQQRGSLWTDFRGWEERGIYIYIYICVWDDFMKICRETPNFVKLGLISGT